MRAAFVDADDTRTAAAKRPARPGGPAIGVNRRPGIAPGALPRTPAGPEAGTLGHPASGAPGPGFLPANRGLRTLPKATPSAHSAFCAREASGASVGAALDHRRPIAGF